LRCWSCRKHFVQLFPGGINWNVERHAAGSRALDERTKFEAFFQALEALKTDIDEGVADA